LKGVNLSLGKGDVAIVSGRSGSGKTSICKIAALLDTDFKGDLRICDARPNSSNGGQKLRLAKIGYIPQFNGLVDTLTIRENIGLPLELLKVPFISDKVENIASRLGISNLLNRFPAQVSGGEAQRTAVARAVVKSPSLIVADEPLSCLDKESALSVCEVFNEFIREDGERSILITSTAADTEFMEPLKVSMTYSMKEGRLTRAET